MITVNWSTEVFQFEYGLAISIQKEYNRLEDGSILNEKHNISLRGSLIASGASIEARYKNLIQRSQDVVSRVAGGADRPASLQDGALVITGSDGEIIRYDSVRLMSIVIADPPENSAGAHAQEATLTFETFVTPSDPASFYKLRSVSENIEYKREDNLFCLENNDIDTEEEPTYLYTISHSISAQGYYNNGTTKSEAFEEAYKYVNARKQDGLSIINTDVFGRPMLGSSNLDVKKYRIANQTSHMVDAGQIDLFYVYNISRVSSTDIPNGSYSLTTNYTLSKQNVSLELSGEYSRQEDGSSSVSVQGTIQGLSTKTALDTVHDKFTNAKTAYVDICGDMKSSSKIYKYAEAIYDRYQYDKVGIALRDLPLSISLGENKMNGTITFNIAYKVYPSQVVVSLNNITGALTANATIIDDNRFGASLDVEVIAMFPIPGRSKGPVIQNMNTTKERKRGATMEVILEPRYRTPINDLVREQVLTEMDQYKPLQSLRWRQVFTENWEWMNGKYSANLEWIYTV